MAYDSPGVYVEEVPSGSAPIAGVGTSTAGFIGRIVSTSSGSTIPPAATSPSSAVPVQAGVGIVSTSSGSTTRAATSATSTTSDRAEVGEVKLCTNFTEFKKFFGDFSSDVNQSNLAHAVYGFFSNGGTRCYVVQVDEIATALEKFEAIDEIAIVAAPGITDKNFLQNICEHCKTMGDRFAILDSSEEINLGSLSYEDAKKNLPDNSDYAALYFPWIQVVDPATKAPKYVPPSGHMAGVYARVDTQRGVHKAPANEVVFGATGLKYSISKSKQDGLNPKGINCIRNLNGNIRVWGARTLGGEDNKEFTYINIRRLFNYLRESIDEGTQWTVFEPNSPELWARISRNLTAFLTTVWRRGALFGNAPEQAFFVKCDEETNPPELRDLGQVVTIIGVAVVKPAEFVIFRISQWKDSGK
ncbi:phage tail sheath C-terminal domain-containing protein [Microcoleus sp. POL10_C6]|uniref:phage tail sheath C-terminal domain-containing protein n=1 Tax=Microcoleus sp. POL10_C6 TaxID=2818852 RepID=UPI002FD5EF14